MALKLNKSLVTLFKEYGVMQNISKKQNIFTEADEATSIYLILSGRVAVSKEAADGKEFTLRISSTDDLLGENIIFTPLSNYPHSAKTIDDCQVLSINRHNFEQLLKQQSNLLAYYLQWTQLQNLRDQSKVRDLLLYGKKGALFSTLIRLSNTYGTLQQDGSIVINERFTHSELASFCATSREVINRLLKELKVANIIAEKQGYIIIYNREYLRQACDCENCPAYVCRIN